MNVLFDTCVIVDCLQNREPFAEIAEQLVLEVAKNNVEGFVSAKSLLDIYYLTHRCTHSDKETRGILEKLLTIFHVVDTTASDCQKALCSEVKDYEDAVMVETAIRTQMDCIVTRNMKDYMLSKCTVYSPEECLRKAIKKN